MGEVSANRRERSDTFDDHGGCGEEGGRVGIGRGRRVGGWVGELFVIANKGRL